MTRPKLLDLYCCAGGAAMGYHIAGFDVVGMDIEPQPNFPFEFRQADITKLTDADVRRIRAEFTFVHASPPCQLHTSLNTRARGWEHPDLIPYTRDLLDRIDLPYVIENVVGAPLLRPVVLCGSSFGLRVRRHRLFEADWPLHAPPCEHDWQDRDKRYWRRISKARGEMMPTGVVAAHGTRQLHPAKHGDREPLIRAVALGIDWMTMDELAQAIPPAYTRFIGQQVLKGATVP